MMISKREVDAFRELPFWVRAEMSERAVVGFIYSGNPLIGWSWSPNIMESMSSDYKEFSEGEVIASEPNFYINYIRNILLSSYNDIEIIARGKEGFLTFGVIFSDECGYREEVLGQGASRLSALLNLLYNVASFYLTNQRPSFSDIRKGPMDHPQASLFEDLEPAELDIFEDDDGNLCVDISCYFTAERFIEKFSRFKEGWPLIQGESQCTSFSSEWFHGTMQMMEGRVLVYSNYGVNKSGSDDISIRNLSKKKSPRAYTYRGTLKRVKV